MQADAFYQQLVEIAAQPPRERHSCLSTFHDQVLTRYLDAIRSISPQGAMRDSSDGRTIAQVVGHIAEWERWTIVAAGEMIAGVRWPRIMALSGYVELDGRTKDFTSLYAFNAYQAVKHSK